MHFPTVIFDLDGVVIDSEPLHTRAKHLAFQAFNIDVPEGNDEFLKGRTDHDVLALVLEMYRVDNVSLTDLIDQKNQAYRSLVPELELVPGVLPFLRTLQARGIRLALTTSATLENQQLAFNKFDLAPYFEVVVTAVDVRRAKPDPEPYLHTLNRLNADPGATLIIEDSTNGVRSGKAAGCAVAALTTSFSEAQLLDAGADLVVDTYTALEQRLGLRDA